MSELSLSTCSRPQHQRCVRMLDVQSSLSCALCGGYLIDATTISKCLHTFCRACIVSHLQAHCACPLCNHILNDFDPHLHLRRDKTLQRLVYKIVPGLYYNELQRRREFEHSHGLIARESRHRRGCHRRAAKRKLSKSAVCCENDMMSVSLHYGVEGYSIKSAVDIAREHCRRQLTLYFRCTANVTVHVIKKLLCMKLEIGRPLTVEIFDRCGELLADHYKLMDIFYIFRSQPVGTVRLHYVIVSAMPVIASSPLSCSGQSATSSSCPLSGRVSTNGSVEWRSGQPCRPVTVKSDAVALATGCSSGSIIMATDSDNVALGNDTVSCVQHHCAAPARHSATSATTNTTINHAGRSVGSGKQHCTGTSESAQWPSAVEQLENQLSAVANSQLQAGAISKSEEHTRSSAVTTTCWTTMTVKPASQTTTTQLSRVTSKDSLTAASDAFVYPRDCLATVPTAMYTNDCAVPMLWLPEQSVTSDDEKESDVGCKVMMSPAPFHFVPLIAAPHPYPCMEPMYVDMASVGMATLGVGMATEHVIVTAGVSVATEHAGMATGGVSMPTDGVGMATADMAGGQVGQCLVPVGDDIATASALLWPTLYQCCDGSLPTLAQPHFSSVTSTTSVHPSAHLSADVHTATSTSCQSQSASFAPTTSILPHTSLTATVLPNTSNACSAHFLDGPESSLTLSDHTDSLCSESVAMMDDPLSADGLVVADDIYVSTSSRPDVVSSNVPRSYMDQQQPQQQDDNDDDVNDENDEMSQDAPALSFDEQINSVDEQPPPSPSSEAGDVEP